MNELPKVADLGRVIVSVVMWGILGGISLGTLFNIATMNLGDVAAAIIIITPLIIAMFGTIAIWSPEILIEGNNKDRPAARNVVSKSKNEDTSKVGLLMELMNDDEREAFKETLRRQILSGVNISSDGELAIDDLFYEDELERRS